MGEDFGVWKERLKENTDIVSIISKYVPLNKKGKTWWGNCPFHFEKTPSFAVNDFDQYYNCFGCGASGDVIKFVEKIESCDFMEAVEILAKDANMKMPEKMQDENTLRLKKDKEVAYAILQEAALYYYNNLKLPEAKKGQEYLQKRNLSSDVVKAFGLGYSIGWNEVVDYLIKKGYTPEQIKIAGVADAKDGKYYDAYAKRLIFPIINGTNDVIGFSARILEDADFAKYKNTSQTIVFDKSKVLYGINNIKKEKQSTGINEIIIVEGQMDLIAMYKNGVKNAVATMGTALTSLHARELKRYANKVVLCFDGDGAGKKATLRSIEILNSSGLEVYVADLPSGIDPDDYINKNGKSEFINLVNKSKYWVQYLIEDYAKSFDLNKPNEKSDFIINALNVVKKLESQAEQNVYLDLIKNLSNISVDVLKSDLLSLDSKNTTSTKSAFDENNNELIRNENSYVKAVKFVIAALLHKKEYAILEDDLTDYIANPDYVKIYDYIKECASQNKKPIISYLFDMFDDVESSQDIKEIINYEFNDSIENGTYYNECVNAMIISGLKEKKEDLVKKSNSFRDMSEKREVYKEIMLIDKKINEITMRIKKQG